MELKVINEITDEIKNFKSIEEFNLFYQKHKDEMNNQTTQYLNRVYKIMTPDGVEYRITKKNCSKEGTKRVGGDVFLRKINKTNDLKELENEILKTDFENLKCELNGEINVCKQSITEIEKSIEKRIGDINKKINELTNTVNQIAHIVNQLSG